MNLKFAKNKKWLVVFSLIVLAAIGGVAYYQLAYLPAHTATDEATLQTAVARRGDLVIYASGSGTLTAAEEYELGFSTGGQVTGVFVQPGDEVKAGDLLAEIDDSQARADFEQAQRAYEELTSDAAIASALQAVADAEQALRSALLQLEYLISPDVMYWETEVEQAKLAVQQAQAALDAAPNDEEAKKALDHAKAYLDFAEAQLVAAQVRYKKYYVYKYFFVESPDGDYLALPTEIEIASARAAIVQARQDLQECKEIYVALTTGVIPAGTDIPELIAIRQAKLNLEAAQETLDGTRIVAPADGTVMSVDTSLGNTAGTSPVIIVANLKELVLDIYLDASDWSNVAVGKPVEAIFDALPDSTFTGTITQIDAELYTSGNTTMVHGTVKLDITSAALDLPLGSSASVDVISAQALDAILIPVEALHETSPGEYAVFVMTNGVPRLRVVEIGIMDLISAEVVSGIEPGEVVTTGITDTNW
ncbi:MAG: HlyD family efflux transporter periplasmic adaptor subunit [Chloroflexota bacterium]